MSESGILHSLPVEGLHGRDNQGEFSIVLSMKRSRNKPKDIFMKKK